jgi:hypothetical protein
MNLKRGMIIDGEIDYDPALSHLRVRIEHAIRRMEKFLVLNDRLRYQEARSANLSIAAGIIKPPAGFWTLTIVCHYV